MTDSAEARGVKADGSRAFRRTSRSPSGPSEVSGCQHRVEGGEPMVNFKKLR
jgi:hypothetical protein